MKLSSSHYLTKLFFKTIFLFSIVIYTSGLAAQDVKPGSSTAVIKKAEGTWYFTLYTDHIIKTTFTPVNAKNNEQVSNAVIIKPSALRPAVKTTDGETAIYYKSKKNIIINSAGIQYLFENKPLAELSSFFTQRENYNGFEYKLTANEKIAGAGERALPQNRRGYRLNLYNNPWYGYEYGADNLNYSVPFIISSNGYGIFFDNPSRGYLDIGKNNSNILEAGFVSGELTFYIIAGKNAEEILKNYHELIGTQPLPPRWALGNFISRFGYRSQAQVDSVVKKMRKENFPADAVILDLFWFGDSIQRTLGNLDWVNKQKWPDPKKMMSDFRKENIKTIIITEPFVLKNTNKYYESLKYHATDKKGNPYTLTDFYFGYGGIVDVFRKDAQQWFRKVYREQIKNGVSGWWTDLGEPEKHPSDLYHNLKDFGFKRLFKADEIHNIFGHYWNQMLYEHYQQEHPDTRLFHLNRSGYAGSPRYSIFPWTGDVSRSWNGLKAQLPILLGMSVSGIPYIHSDAGGFAMTDKKDPELYTRWLQLSAFSPVFRPHGTALEADLQPSGTLSVESEPVFWPDSTKAIVKNLIQLRYDLTPYNYTLAYQQAKYGKPLMRPMYYQNFSDENLTKAEDQYMWGDNILVAPVTEKGARIKRIYFPAGRWYDFMRNRFYDGGQWIMDSAALSEVPMFVKQGGFVPTVWGYKNLDNYTTAKFFVLYFPSAKKTFYEMYDDDGLTNKAIEKKQYELLQMEGMDAGNEIQFSIRSNGGKFTGRPGKRVIRFYIPEVKKQPSAILLNDKTMENILYAKEKRDGIRYEPGVCVYNADTKMLTVVIEFSDKPVSVKIEK